MVYCCFLDASRFTCLEVRGQSSVVPEYVSSNNGVELWSNLLAREYNTAGKFFRGGGVHFAWLAIAKLVPFQFKGSLCTQLAAPPTHGIMD